jgi:glutamate 5-kinase
MQDLVRQELATATLVVVKVGTRVLTRQDGTLDLERIGTLAEQIHKLRRAGRQVVLVSSGAVGAGMSHLGLQTRPTGLAQLQAVAAVGQTKLIEAYDAFFRQHGEHAAQVLLTAEDLGDRDRYLNVRNTVLSLLELNAIPIINENDTVAVDELMRTFGDNDRLAALVTNAIRAPLMIILSDVDGLYDGPPDKETSRVIPTVKRVDSAIAKLANDNRNSVSKGGMASKLEAARMATSAGEAVIIASGRETNILPRLLSGEVLGTAFLAEGKLVSPRKRWISFSAHAPGRLYLDDGACQAITRLGRSLLPIGVTATEGQFSKGDAVRLCDQHGNEVGRGLTNYAADEVDQIKGLRTDQIQSVLGHCPYKHIVHRDNMAITDRGEN